MGLCHKKACISSDEYDLSCPYSSTATGSNSVSFSRENSGKFNASDGGEVLFDDFRLGEALKFVENLWELNKRSCGEDDILFCLKLCGGVHQFDKTIHNLFFETYKINKTFDKGTTNQSYVGFVATVCRVVTADKSNFLMNDEVDYLCSWLLGSFLQLDLSETRSLSALDVTEGLPKLLTGTEYVITEEESSYLFSKIDHERRGFIGLADWIMLVHIWLVEVETLPSDSDNLSRRERVPLVPRRESQIGRYPNRAYIGNIYRFRKTLDPNSLHPDILAVDVERDHSITDKKEVKLKERRRSFSFLGRFARLSSYTLTRIRRHSSSLKLKKQEPLEFRRSMHDLLGNYPRVPSSFLPVTGLQKEKIQEILHGRNSCQKGI